MESTAREVHCDFSSSDLGAASRCSDGGYVADLGVARLNPGLAEWTVTLRVSRRDATGRPGTTLLYDEETLADPGDDPLGAGFARLGEMLTALAARENGAIPRDFARRIIAASWPDVTLGRANVVAIRPAAEAHEREATTGT